MNLSEKAGAVIRILEQAVWGTPTLFLLVFTGILLTVRTGGFQFRSFFPMLKHTLGSITRRSADKTASPGEVSPFQALCTALSATIGTGNIAGVAYALVMGGAGAVFWMWAAAGVGMILKYAESVLAVRYRVQTPEGVRGGAMYYLERGFAERFGMKKFGKALALIFSLSAVAASFGMGNMSQVAAIKESVFAVIDAPAGADGLWIGAAAAAAAALVILGGAQRVARANERLVPFMALFYTAGSFIILAVYADRILPAFGSIFTQAFCLSAAAHGTAGYALARAVSWGFKRGIFSNEAGLGSSAAIHAASSETVPSKQGYWGIFEVFFDTGVICTLTALVILVTGVSEKPGVSTAQGAGLSLAVEAFADVFGRFGGYFIAFAVTLFAFSSILGWSFYGVRAWEYVFGTKSICIYKAAFAAAALPGALLGTQEILRVSDIFNGLMALPNLVGLLALVGVVSACTPKRGERTNRKMHLNFCCRESESNGIADKVNQSL